MLKIVFLDADTVGDINALDKLKQLGDVTLHPYTDPHDTLNRIKNANVILTNKVQVRKEHIDSCPHLQLIAITATGMNNVDVEYARQKGIKVQNVVGYAVETVAQHTFAVLLSFINQISYYDNYVKTGLYSQNKTFTHIKGDFYELAGKRLGIIGLGNIGQAVARIAQGFGMEVVYHSASGNNVNQPFKHLSLKELLNTSDIVSINAPLNDKTKNLLDYAMLKQMKSSGILLNMGRGGIVVEADLAKAIDEKCIAGACIDVYEQEPIPLSHPYLNVKEKERIILTPHVAWAAREARERMMNTIVENIKQLSL